MKLFPIVNPFPLIQRPYTYNDLQRSEACEEPLEERLGAISPVDLVQKVTEDTADNRLPNALRAFLGMSEEYSKWKKAMPCLKDVPNIHKYKNEHPGYDPVQVDREIREHGGFLTSGQVLYHGGTWPETSVLPKAGDEYELDRVLSTTLCPQVAATHARYHNPYCIWIITVGSSTKTPVFVFNNNGQRLSHEVEVLFANKSKISCTSTKQANSFLIYEITIT